MWEETLREKQNRLAIAAKAGDQRAAAELIPTLMGLVNSRIPGLMGSGCSRDDLQAAGALGIWRAIQSFDPDISDIASFAPWLIYEEMMLVARAGAGVIKMPSSRPAKKIAFHASRSVSRYESQGLSKSEAYERAAADLNVSVSDLETFFGMRFPSKVSTDPDFDETLSETPDPISGLNHERVREMLRTAIDDLVGREREVIELRYCGEEFVSLDSIGEAWGVSRDVVRRVERRAIAKIRSDMELRGLSIEDMLDG